MNIRASFVLFCTLALATVATAVADNVSERMPEQPVEAAIPGKSLPRQTSAWGSSESGLEMRVTAPAEIEQGMPLPTQLEIRYDRDRLGPDIERLNLFLRDAFIELELTKPMAEKRWTVTPYDPTAGMPPPMDSGRAAVALDGLKIEPWRAKFPLLKLHDELQPGRYVARVRFTFPKEPTRYWRGTKAEWNKAGFWHGTLVSAPFRLHILKETSETRTLLVPSKLRFRKEWVHLHKDDVKKTAVPAVYFDQRDAKKVEVPVRNGHFIGTWIYKKGEHSSLHGGLIEPDGPNAINVWYNYQGGGKKVSYAIEVFETAEPPQHGWMPSSGSTGYRVLWKKRFN